MFNSSVGTILYTYIHFKAHNHRHKRFMNERTVHNETSVVIDDLAKGTNYVFSLCLGNKEGKGPCKEVAITTSTTGNYHENCVNLPNTALAFIHFDSFDVAPSIPIVMAQRVSINAIQVSWEVEDDGGNPSLKYSIRMTTDLNSVGEMVLDNAVVEDMQYQVKNLMPGTSYWFSVVAHSASGDSAMGWSIETTTSPCE